MSVDFLWQHGTWTKQTATDRPLLVIGHVWHRNKAWISTTTLSNDLPVLCNFSVNTVSPTHLLLHLYCCHYTTITSSDGIGKEALCSELLTSWNLHLGPSSQMKLRTMIKLYHVPIGLHHDNDTYIANIFVCRRAGAKSPDVLVLPCSTRNPDVLVLPCGTTKTEVRKLYVKACGSDQSKSYSVSCETWNKFLPGVCIQKPRTDLCAICKQDTLSLLKLRW